MLVSSPRAVIVSARCRECGVERRPSPCSRAWTRERVGSFQTLNRAEIARGVAPLGSGSGV